MRPDWLKFKKYPHIGKPLTSKKDSKWVVNYVTDPEKIAKHKFTPLLHKKIYQRRYRPNPNAAKTPSGKRERSVQKPKERPIFYASHLDSLIYNYYSHLLAKAYENYISDKAYSICPVAYRKIPIIEGKQGNKCNIEFASDTFNFIEQNKHRKLSMIVSDITSFFDNLDHRILHQQWKRVLGVDNLGEDHYRLYKNLTSKRYVNENELFKRFQHKLIVERGLENDDTRTRLTDRHVKKIWNLKRERVVAYCTKEDFFSTATDLIRIEKACSHQHMRCRNNCELKGIPQGTPMSAVLANIYMLDFDEKIFLATQEKGAYYQRYSDDLIIICDQEDEVFFYKLIQGSIENLAKLEIQPQKTNRYRYEKIGNEFVGGILTDRGVIKNKQLEYLGFEYDGKKVRVKTVGFSKFYRSMKRSFRRGTHFASKPENKSRGLFKARLYKRFSYQGAKRRLIYKPSPKSDTGYIRTAQYDWGNYISYLEKANRAMKSINRDDAIKNQYSKFWSNFGKEMKKANKKIAQRVANGPSSLLV